MPSGFFSYLWDLPRINLDKNGPVKSNFQRKVKRTRKSNTVLKKRK